MLVECSFMLSPSYYLIYICWRSKVEWPPSRYFSSDSCFNIILMCGFHHIKEISATNYSILGDSKSILIIFLTFWTIGSLTWSLWLSSHSASDPLWYSQPYLSFHHHPQLLHIWDCQTWKVSSDHSLSFYLSYNFIPSDPFFTSLDPVPLLFPIR